LRPGDGESKRRMCAIGPRGKEKNKTAVQTGCVNRGGSKKNRDCRQVSGWMKRKNVATPPTDG